jgi:hypothetical protein
VSDKRIEELLAKVARELVKDVHLPAHSLYLVVLRRELLPLLKAGALADEAAKRGLRYFRGDQESAILTIAEDGSTLTDFQETAKAAREAWDAALGGSEESDGPK